MTPEAALAKLASSLEGGGEARAGQVAMAEAVAAMTGCYELLLLNW